MKYLILGFMFLLSGCAGWLNRTSAYIGGYQEVCIDEVSYLQFPSGVTVKYDQSGKVEICGGKVRETGFDED